MPVVGTTAYDTAGQITALVRWLLNDAAGNLRTDAVLLPYLNFAYRKAQRELGSAEWVESAALSELSDPNQAKQLRAE